TRRLAALPEHAVLAFDPAEICQHPVNQGVTAGLESQVEENHPAVSVFRQQLDDLCAIRLGGYKITHLISRPSQCTKQAKTSFRPELVDISPQVADSLRPLHVILPRPVAGLGQAQLEAVAEPL